MTDHEAVNSSSPEPIEVDASADASTPAAASTPTNANMTDTVTTPPTLPHGVGDDLGGSNSNSANGTGESGDGLGLRELPLERTQTVLMTAPSVDPNVPLIRQASSPRGPMVSPTSSSGRKSLSASDVKKSGAAAASASSSDKKKPPPIRTTPQKSINPSSEINSRLDTQVEVRVYPCNNSSSSGKKKFTQFMVKPEGVIIQGASRSRGHHNDLGTEYANHIGRKLQRYELSDTRACQLLVTTHNKSFWVVPAPEAFSRHSGTCRLLGDRKHVVASHTLQVGDFLRVGSVGVVVIETHNGEENRILSEEKIQKIMRDTTSSNGGFLDLAETDGGEFCGRKQNLYGRA